MSLRIIRRSDITEQMSDAGFPNSLTNTHLPNSRLQNIVRFLKNDSDGYVEFLKKSVMTRLVSEFQFKVLNNSLPYYLHLTAPVWVRTNDVNPLTGEILVEGEWKDTESSEEIWIQFNDEWEILDFVNTYTSITHTYQGKEYEWKSEEYKRDIFNSIISTDGLVRLYISDDIEEQYKGLEKYISEGKYLEDYQQHLENFENKRWNYPLNGLKTTTYKDGFFNFEGRYFTRETSDIESKIVLQQEFDNSSFEMNNMFVGDYLFWRCNIGISKVLDTPSLMSGEGMYATSGDVTNLHFDKVMNFKQLVNGKDMFRGTKFNVNDLQFLYDSLNNVSYLKQGDTVSCITNDLYVNKDVYIGDTTGQGTPISNFNIINVKIDKTITVGVGTIYDYEIPYYTEMFAQKGWTLEMSSIEEIIKGPQDYRTARTLEEVALLYPEDIGFDNNTKRSYIQSGPLTEEDVTSVGNKFINLITTDDNFGYPASDSRFNSLQLPIFRNTIRFSADLSSLQIGDNLFNECTLLENFDAVVTSNLLSARSMFHNCKNLKNVGNNVNLVGLRDGEQMFYSCESLESINVSTSNNLTNATYMFYNCPKLKNLGEKFDFSGVTNAKSMFDSCISLITLPDNFNASSLQVGNYMFMSCKSLEDLGQNFNLSNLTSANFMFYGCNLSEESIATISRTINDVYAKNGSSHNYNTYRIDIHTKRSLTDYDIENLKNIARKGWNVMSKANGESYNYNLSNV